MSFCRKHLITYSNVTLFGLQWDVRICTLIKHVTLYDITYIFIYILLYHFLDLYSYRNMIYDRYYNFHVTPWNIITNIQTSRFVKAMTITYCTCLYFYQLESFISNMFILSSNVFVWNDKDYTINLISTDLI